MSNLLKHLISSAQCESLVNEYKRTNYKAINSQRPASEPDSRLFLIELDVLKEYLQLIENEMNKLGIQNKGFQVTLGKYPENSTDSKINPAYLGRQTIFFSAVDLDENISSDETDTEGRLIINTPDNAADTGLSVIPCMNYMNVVPPSHAGGSGS